MSRPLDVLLDLLFNNIHHYLGHLKVIKLVARELQQKFKASMQNQHLIQMFNLSESLIYYINAIHSNHAAKEHFSADRRPGQPEEQQHEQSAAQTDIN